MSKFQDIAVDENNDLFIGADGDIAIQDSDYQHVVDLIYSYKGFWRNSPQTGVGIQQYLNSSGKDQEISQAVKLQLVADGYQVNAAVIKKGFDSNGTPTFSIDVNATRP